MNDRDLVSASKIGKMAWCPHGGSLQEQGVIASVQSRAKAEYGTASHERLTAATIERQAQDQRCFVASYALGPNHAVTQQLRDWRDSHLSRYYVGTIFIKVYYAWSPLAIKLVSRIPGARSAASSLVLAFARMVAGNKDT
ncbi:hypothetical protein E4188_23745 (plasmid) [Aeromonas media]|uniref:Uncharacterized protein n=2 Tax=Aeromonas TaxID=642 RepID=A0ABX6NYR0_AERME|nr:MULTISPECIES: CFI-box-CTERM domain-containing protein [Aeromonas]ASI21468.1 hypothetical protein CE456_01065 [Aeromonas salmonicida]QJT41505.1 hypothetical protein E4188_23745 [Aeromonas media]QLI59095.1 hypothetical protein C0708_23390 [Aeromonas caviae]QLI60322.1 hypothetical protein C1C91_23035 [Aeromonas caviae]HDN9373709.1 hypothetical protein [Aeromonas salmonicida]